MKDRTRRIRLALGLGLAGVLLLAVAWQLGKSLLDVDQYRAIAAEEIARYTGFPVSIGRLDLALRPIPALSAFDVSIGDGELRAQVARIDILPVLGALWQRRLEISRIQLGALELTLPTEPARIQQRWDDLLRQLEIASQPATTPSLWSSLLDGFAMHRVTADDARVHLGEGGDPWLHTSVRVQGIAAAAMEVELDTRLASLGTQLTGRLHIPQETGQGSELRGEFRLRADWPERAPGSTQRLHAGIDATAELRGDPEGELVLVIDGDVVPRAEGALSGHVTAQLHLLDGALRGSFAADGPVLRLRGSTQAEDGGNTLRIESLEAGPEGVTALLEWLENEELALLAGDTSTLTLRGVEVGFAPEAAPRLVSGSLSASGIEARRSGRALASDVALDMEVVDGGLAIRSLRGAPFDLSGELRIEPDWSRLELALRGDIELTPGLLASLGAPTPERLSGRIRLEELRQAFPDPRPGVALPLLRARVADAALRVAGEGWSDEVSGVELRVASEGSTLRMTGQARSQGLGDVSASATLDTASRQAQGRVAVDPTSARGLGDAQTWNALAALLGSWGSEGVAVAASWPEGPEAELSLRVERKAFPSLHSQLALRPGREDALLGDLRVDAQLPDTVLRSLLPAGLESSGSAALSLERNAERASFSLNADLGALTLRSGHFVEKRSGEVLRVRVEGEAPAQGFRPKRLVIDSAKGSLPLEWRGERLVAPTLDVDLAAWSFLLSNGAVASGRLQGALATQPFDTRLTLSGVGLRLSPELGIDAANGSIAVKADGWSVRELRMQGAGSDLLVDVAFEGEQVRGRIEGAALDVDLVRALLHEIQALLPDAPEPAAGAAKRTGSLSVKLDRVAAGRSQATGLVTEIHFAGGDVHVPAFSFQTYEGRISGALDVVAQPEHAPSRLALKLDVTEVTGRFLDDLFFDAAPRGIRGVFSGKLDFAAPLDHARSMLAQGNGRLSFSARSGSFGKLGFATKITTALRASEALRLRLPAMKDEGLVFDTVNADLPMREGRLGIELFELDTTSYAINAEGNLDFARDRSDVPIEFNATKGLTGILSQVPIAGDLLQIVNVRLKGSGSPYDLKVSIASFKDQVVRATLAGPKSLVKRVRDAVALAKRNGKAPAAEPGTAPDASPAPSEAPEPDSVPVPVPELEPAPEPLPEAESVAAAEAPPPTSPAPVASGSSPADASAGTPGSPQ